MQVPNTAVQYILFQRTAHLRLELLYRLLDKLLPFSIYERGIKVEAAISRERVKAAYVSDMQNEYLSIKEHLPASCSAVLDIGCGVAGIDVFIQRHYNNHNISFYLLDKTSTERQVYYGFKQKGAFYNSLPVAKDLLCLNGAPESNIELLEATDTNDINLTAQLDLVISLVSWGFHYPVPTYLETVYELLSEGGKLIIDVRKETGGLELLKDRFGNYQIIADFEKYSRILCVRES